MLIKSQRLFSFTGMDLDTIPYLRQFEKQSLLDLYLEEARWTKNVGNRDGMALTGHSLKHIEIIYIIFRRPYMYSLSCSMMFTFFP